MYFFQRPKNLKTQISLKLVENIVVYQLKLENKTKMLKTEKKVLQHSLIFAFPKYLFL